MISALRQCVSTITHDLLSFIFFLSFSISFSLRDIYCLCIGIISLPPFLPSPNAISVPPHSFLLILLHYFYPASPFFQPYVFCFYVSLHCLPMSMWAQRFPFFFWSCSSIPMFHGNIQTVNRKISLEPQKKPSITSHMYTTHIVLIDCYVENLV